MFQTDLAAPLQILTDSLLVIILPSHWMIHRPSMHLIERREITQKSIIICRKQGTNVNL
jgi:hypothetical protein